MSFNRNRLYLILLIACTAGYIWIYINLSSNLIDRKLFEICPIKHLTNIPCPSCGSTRSIISLTKGNIIESLNINPIGIIDAMIMLVVPPWMFLDIITKRRTLYNFYKKIENYLKDPKHIVFFAFLIIINWVWNIIKGFQ